MRQDKPTPAFIAPRLTLHIEADTMEELMLALDQVMGSLNPDHISAARYTEGVPAVELDVHGSKEEADAAADANAAAKRGRGRPRKTDTATTADTPAPTAAQEAEDEDIAAKADAAAAPAVDANAMKNLSPADARNKGIAMVTAFFASNPACLPQVQQISAKYGVGQFADIPDAQAHAFLADISLLTSGAGQV